MVEGVVFVGLAVVALTQFVKEMFPDIKGSLTVLVAAAIGLVIALVDTHIGVVDMTIAQGIMTGLAAAGTHTVARQIG